jgi:hypothetical protein
MYGSTGWVILGVVAGFWFSLPVLAVLADYFDSPARRRRRRRRRW